MAEEGKHELINKPGQIKKKTKLVTSFGSSLPPNRFEVAPNRQGMLLFGRQEECERGPLQRAIPKEDSPPRSY